MRICGRRSLPFAVSLCVIGTLAPTSVPSAGQSHPKRVLLLFDEHRTLPGLAVLDQTLRSTLRDGLDAEVEFFTESLNAAQFPEEQHGQVLRDYYVKKYVGRKLDLIVAVMGPAVTFLLRHGDAFAPGVPVVFCGADADAVEGATLPSRMTGLFVRRVFGPTLDVALRLQPETQHVFVVGGTSNFDRHLQAAARREVPAVRAARILHLSHRPAYERSPRSGVPCAAAEWHLVLDAVQGRGRPDIRSA